MESSDTARITLKDTSAYAQGTGPYIQFQGLDNAGTNRNFGQIWGISDTSNNGELDFKVRSSGSMISAMRLDASGNLLVGKTSSDATATGFEAQGNGQTIIGRANGTALKVNRLSSDGPIAQFRKDGTNVGSIGTSAGHVTIGNGATGLRFVDASTDRISPWNLSTNTDRDNAIDLGESSGRFDDIYATNGTIQTSDRNEKQDIAELSDAEQRVAVAAKGLMRKFRWRDAVEAKGDEARTHFGIIAQDLQAAFAAEGLDAGD